MADAIVAAPVNNQGNRAYQGTDQLVAPVMVPGALSAGGVVQPASITNPLPVTLETGGVNIGAVTGAVLPQVTGNITAADVTAAPHTPPTAGSFVQASGLAGYETVNVTLEGTYATGATLQFEATNDGGLTYQTVPSVKSDMSNGAMGGFSPGANAIGTYRCAIGGCTVFRVRATAFGASGTINVYISPYEGFATPSTLSILTNTAGTSIASVATANDGVATGTGLGVAGQLYGWNGASWDRIRNNTNQTVLASASRTTTQTSADIPTYNQRGLHLITDVTVAGTGSITVTINGKDAVSGKYYPLLVGTAYTTNATNILRIGPALIASANAVANDLLPPTIQIVVTANNANAITYSVGLTMGD